MVACRGDPEKKWSSGWIWMVIGALLFLVLCVGGILVRLWAQTPEAATPPEAPGGNQTAPPTGAPPTGAPPTGAPPTGAPESGAVRMSIRNVPMGIRSGVKPAIHVECDIRPLMENQTEQLLWSDHVGGALAQGGFRLEDNQIVVPQTGLYFIYSQVTFRSSCSDGPKLLHHRIKHLSEAYSESVTFLRAVQQTACPEEDHQPSINHVYLGSLVYLWRGTRLWTETSPLGAVEEEDTFFGLFEV